mmetsp:Transcript_14944/g.38190  ORF Transcript_14944/g.38190 Transcript_14944/m.38190 type:complete len:81 (+) Transcript_14944:272-514(+)
MSPPTARDERDAAEKACQKLACAIQTCLRRHQYQQDRCDATIEAWNRCVEEQQRLARAATPGGSTGIPGGEEVKRMERSL